MTDIRSRPAPMKSRYDVVIVGAGAFGLASAYHLADARPHLSILVVEARSRPGEGSMGASSGMVRDVFSSKDNHILAKSSIRFYRRMMEEHEELRSPAPLLDLYGYLWLLPESLRDAYYSIVAEESGSIDAELLGPDDLRSLPGLNLAPTKWYEGESSRPEPITGGLFGRNCGAVAPEILADFYCRSAQERGVEFVFDTCVQRLSFEGRDELLLHDDSKLPFAFQREIRGRVQISGVVFGDGRTVRTDRVIVAAGAWSEKLLHPIGIPTACSPRPESQFAVSGPVVTDLLTWQPPVHPVDTDGGRPRFPFVILPTGAVLKPIFPQHHLWIEYLDSVAHPIGTREDPGRDGRLDYNMAAMGDREGFPTDILPAVTPYLPQFETSGVRLESTWGGYYNFSPEGLPIIEEAPCGVLFVGGDSGSGIMKADSLGRLVAAKLQGRSTGALFGGDLYPITRLSLEHRAVEEEKIIL
jgi:FAD-dependent oxidoreductase domain-containing protein 1